MPYIGNELAAQFQAFQTQTITGDGSTGYTLDRAVANGKELLVYINNVKQEEGSGKSYTASGTTITFSEAVASGDSCYLVYMGLAMGTVVPPDGSVTSAKLDTNIAVSGTLGVTGAVTANAGISVDNITIDGTEIDLSSGDLTLDVAGNILLDADGGQVQIRDGGTGFLQLIKDSNDAQIQAGVQDGDLVFKGNDGGSTIEAMRIDISEGGKVGIGTTSPSAKLSVSGTGTVDLGIGSTNAGGAYLYLDGDSNGDFSGSDYSYIGHDTSGQLLIHQDSPSGSDNIIFSTTATERMRVDSSGNLLQGCTTTPSSSVSGNRLANILNVGACIFSVGNYSSAAQMLIFMNANGNVGNIVTSGSGTAYNTSSDYRLKENVVTDWDATSRLKQLKPSRFNFKADKDTTVDGFLAHEVSSIVPEAISGEKDAVDKDGNPEYQGIDQSKLVPLLVKTVQELEERIAKLEAK